MVHGLPSSQLTHTLPDFPHAVTLVPLLHVLPERQPEQHVLPAQRPVLQAVPAVLLL